MQIQLYVHLCSYMCQQVRTKEMGKFIEALEQVPHTTPGGNMLELKAQILESK